LSPEAEAAVAAFSHFQGNLMETLLGCGSGKELVQRGFALDVELAADYAVSSAAPRLVNDRFTPGK
jgi:2-phosphosulfolactate phosphatase